MCAHQVYMHVMTLLLLQGCCSHYAVLCANVFYTLVLLML